MNFFWRRSHPFWKGLKVKVENGGQGGRVGRRRRKMEIRVNTGPSSPRENKSSVIWEFSSGASIDNNLAQPYIQQKYNVKLSFSSWVPFRAETLFESILRFLKLKSPVFAIYKINFEKENWVIRNIEILRKFLRDIEEKQSCSEMLKKINERCEADIMADSWIGTTVRISLTLMRFNEC